uniref:Cytidyltransferase-like domain-containing protein n=1 Tax=Kalanchoe fedtschenkoi TaxID=63787 RepID=A0A7N0RAA2_KALFE
MIWLKWREGSLLGFPLQNFDWSAMDTPLRVDKLLNYKNCAWDSSTTSTKDMPFVVLVSPGSFNPPTHRHLRLSELARDALNTEGYTVLGGYMCPVNDAYKKKDLASAEHRIKMCQLACKTSQFVMVDEWEVFLFPLYKQHALSRIICLILISLLV